MSGIAKERSSGFDALKGIACIAVVFMHCEFPGTVGVLTQCLMRWSVPLFFAISGFFFRKETVVEALRKAGKILKIAIWATLLYLVFGVVLHLIHGDLAAYLKAELTVSNLGAFLVFNSPVFVNGHLWFLYALIYVYLAQAVIIRLGLGRREKPLCVVLLVMHFLLGYGSYLLGHSLQGGFYRNFIFEGLPFFLLGKWSQRMESVQGGRLFADRRIGVSLVLAGSALTVAERMLVGRDFSVHISSVAVLVGLLILAASRSMEDAPKWLTKIGREYSDMIYILHPAVYLTMDALMVSTFESNGVYGWIRPVLTVLLSLILAASAKRIFKAK